MHGLARQIKFLHIVFFAMTARCVSFAAIGYLAGGAAIYVLAFWGEATVTAHLLIVAWAITGGARSLFAIVGPT